MLTLSTRGQYATLLDAVTLREADDRPAIIYVASDAPPITCLLYTSDAADE